MNTLCRLQKKLQAIESLSNAPQGHSLGKLNRFFTIFITKGENGNFPNYALFGFNLGYTFIGNAYVGPNYDGGEIVNPITVNVSQSSANNMMRDVAENPIVLEFCKYKTNNVNNLTNSITYLRQDSTGLVEQKVITPINYLETDYKYTQNQLIYLTDFKDLLFDGSHALTGYIEPNSTIAMSFTIKRRVVPANAAYSENIVTENKTPSPNTIKIINAQANGHI